MDRPLVALDTETATVRGAPHLVELAAVRVDGGEVVDAFERLVRPLVPIEPEARDTHGITDEDVASADEAPDVLRDFLDWIGEDWLVAHNARADAHVVAFECARHGLDAPANPLVDTLALARRELGDAPDHRLPTLVAWLELEIDELHRALADAVACWKVLEACLERHGGWDAVSAARLAELARGTTSLAAATPLRPRRRPALLRRLERARSDDEAVWIVYGEAHEVPARLEVRPRLLYRSGPKGFVEAECVRSGLLKTYRLDRVHRIEA